LKKFLGKTGTGKLEFLSQNSVAVIKGSHGKCGFFSNVKTVLMTQNQLFFSKVKTALML